MRRAINLMRKVDIMVSVGIPKKLMLLVLKFNLLVLSSRIEIIMILAPRALWIVMT